MKVLVPAHSPLCNFKAFLDSSYSTRGPGDCWYVEALCNMARSYFVAHSLDHYGRQPNDYINEISIFKTSYSTVQPTFHACRSNLVGKIGVLGEKSVARMAGDAVSYSSMCSLRSSDTHMRFTWCSLASFTLRSAFRYASLHH